MIDDNIIDERMKIGRMFKYTLDKDGTIQKSAHDSCVEYIENDGRIEEEAFNYLMMFYDCFMRDIESEKFETITSKGKEFRRLKD